MLCAFYVFIFDVSEQSRRAAPRYLVGKVGSGRKGVGHGLTTSACFTHGLLGVRGRRSRGRLDTCSAAADRRFRRNSVVWWLVFRCGRRLRRHHLLLLLLLLSG